MIIMEKFKTIFVSNCIYLAVNGIMFWIAYSGDSKLENVPLSIYSVVIALSVILIPITSIMFAVSSESNTKYSKIVCESFQRLKKGGFALVFSLAKSAVSICLMFAIGFAVVPSLYILTIIFHAWLNSAVASWLDEHKLFMVGKQYETEEDD